MDFLKAAIANSKQKLAQPASINTSTKRKAEEESAAAASSAAAAAASSSSEPQPKKFKSRGEIEAERVAKLAREKEERIAARQAAAAGTTSGGYTSREQRAETAAAAASAAAATAAAAAAPSTPASVALAKAESDAAGMINANEVKRRLRSYSEPITLFGESDLARFQRLKLFELVQHEKAHSSHGAQNTFAQILQQDVESEIKAAMIKDMEERRKMEQEAAAAEGTSAASSSSAAAAAAASGSPDADGVLLDETGKPIKAVQSKKDPAASASSARSGPAPADLRRADFGSAEEFIIHFFKRMLNEWEAELDARPNDVRQSERGKIASAVQKQTHQFLKPLLKLLKTRTASADVLKACEKIVTACLDRRYNLADEAYLTMAIGNAAWPMGVTMVSIHERAGRTKIFSGQVAHVLNDDTQRKYIQSIKRLMTYCREHYPTPYSELLEGK